MKVLELPVLYVCVCVCVYIHNFSFNFHLTEKHVAVGTLIHCELTVYENDVMFGILVSFCISIKCSLARIDSNLYCVSLSFMPI